MPTLSRDANLQTVITTFEVSPATCQDLLDEVRESYEAFIRHQPGFVGAAIHMNDARTRIAIYSQWRDRAAFQAMLRADEMRARMRRFSELCRTFEPVMYDLTDTFG
jgi:quinol monooxygenase YgiN